MYRETKAWGVAPQAWLRTQRFAWLPLQQTFKGSLRALDEVEARLESLNQQVLDFADAGPYAANLIASSTLNKGEAVIQKKKEPGKPLTFTVVTKDPDAFKLSRRRKQSHRRTQPAKRD